MLPVSRSAQPLSARFVRAAANIPASSVFYHYPEQGPQPGRAGAGLLGGNWQPLCKQRGPQASQPCGVGVMGVPPPPPEHFTRVQGTGGREQGLPKASSDPAAASPFPRKPREPFFEFLLILATPAPPPGRGLREHDSRAPHLAPRALSREFPQLCN